MHVSWDVGRLADTHPFEYIMSVNNAILSFVTAVVPSHFPSPLSKLSVSKGITYNEGLRDKCCLAVERKSFRTFRFTRTVSESSPF